MKSFKFFSVLVIIIFIFTLIVIIINYSKIFSKDIYSSSHRETIATKLVNSSVESDKEIYIYNAAYIKSIIYPSFGQRYTYQAEKTGKWRNTFPSFGYDSSDYDSSHDIIDSKFGNSIISKHCEKGVDKKGYLVKNLFENCSQTNNVETLTDIDTDKTTTAMLHSDIKNPKYNIYWNIKPRMRIDPEYAITHPRDTVVVIYIKNFGGTIIDSTAIRCINFLKLSEGQFIYDGEYIEKYYNFGNHISENAQSIQISALRLSEGRTADKSIYESKVDYQIKWMGTVDVWLDYVRVDDSWADCLFSEGTDEGTNISNINQSDNWKFKRHIYRTIEKISSQGAAYNFYIAGIEYSNIECANEVKRLVEKYSAGKLSVIIIPNSDKIIYSSGFRNIELLTYPDHNNIAINY